MKLLLLVLSIFVVSFAQASYPELETVERVELNRYLGKWYEIARFEQSFQKDCTAVTAEYKLRKNGLQDEFTLDDGSTPVSLETIETAQKQLRENRDMSLLTGVILYVLQIVEASVNAHLIQFNTDDNLSFKPALIMDPINIETPTVGLTIKYNF